MAKKDKAAVRRAVHTRIRRRVNGTQTRPRLAIFRSLNHIYAQLIDDERAVTIASASTVEKDLRGGTGGNLEAAVRVGRAIAERAIAKGIESVVFDRGGFRYHGRVKALTDAAREAGLNKNERSEEEGATAEGAATEGAEAAA
ncbi:MAG: large subunit ribosomal protein [Acidobacteriota bacterium]|jgi:large subunit ribosomal protein L18|nr:large subunit ribosomal protein [Acidobacteriota bacterium]